VWNELAGKVGIMPQDIVGDASLVWEWSFEFHVPNFTFPELIS